MKKLFAILLLSCAPIFGSDIVVSWDYPADKLVDPNALTSFTVYESFAGNEPKIVAKVVDRDQAGALATLVSLRVSQPGLYVYTITASYGPLESVPSNEAKWEEKLEAPTNVRILVNFDPKTNTATAEVLP